VSVNTDVLIVGGGIIGSACARELALAGGRVTVIDPEGPAGQAWQAAAGLLAPQIEAAENDALLEVGLAGREWYAAAREELETVSGMPLGLALSGIMSLARTEAEAQTLRERVADQRQHGLFCDWLEADEARAQYPWLPEIMGALVATEDGAVNPARVVEALIADGHRLGIRRVNDRITALDSRNGRVLGAHGKDTYSAGTVVLAAGAWTGRVADLPRPVSVEPVRGQMVAFARPGNLADAIIYSGGRYVLTRENEVIAGSTMEHAGFSAENSPHSISRISDSAAEICGLLAGLEPSRTWVGLRPGTPDGLPILGKEPRCEGLWYATGHGRNGVLLAGITGVVLAQMMAGEATLESVAAFRPERFWDW
jgi:glycine oxidase